MNKYRYAKIIFCGIILTAVWYGWTQAHSANPASAEQGKAGSESEPNSTAEVGRDNPFASVFGNEKPAVTQRISQTPQPVEEKPELFVESVTLKFLDAQNLKSAIAGMSSGNGTISVDSKSNSLIVCDTKENLEKILAKIRKVDRKPDQVMIEVVLLDVELDNETEIGVDWDMLTTKYNGNLNNSKQIGTSFRQNITSSRVESVDGTNADNIAAATAFDSVIGTGSDFSLIFSDIRAVIHTLQQKNNVEIIASPRVMVVSGKDASIESVEEIPYQEVTQSTSGGGGSSAITSTQFKNVGVTLTVGALLTEDKSILLNVQADQKVQTGTSTAVAAGTNGVPIVDARVVKSSLLLEDGQVVVIGGLRRKQTQKQTNQIPLLGDIPIIGFAFKDTIVTQNNSELLILISPHIYKGQAPDSAQMAKFNEISKQPLLTIPETAERKAAEEKIAQEAEKAKQAK